MKTLSPSLSSVEARLYASSESYARVFGSSRFSGRKIAFCLCILLSLSAGCRRDDGNPVPGSITLARLNESFHQASGAIVEEVLRDLGHQVEVIEGPHAELYPRFAAGEADLFAASWLPNGHSTYWQQYGDRFVQLTPLYEGARFFWAVPAYIPANLVSSIADLSRPELAGRLELDIQGVMPGTGLMRVSGDVMREYGLTTAGYRLLEGSVPLLIAHIDRAMAGERWFITPLWQPQFLNQVYPFRVLEDPRGLLGTPDQAFLLGYQGIEQRLPATTLAVLRRIRVNLQDITEMDLMINRQGMTPNEAARTWMNAHPDQVQAWRQ
jgi:glycine betaine/proline transport system substrate-binding protein